MLSTQLSIQKNLPYILLHRVLVPLILCLSFGGSAWAAPSCGELRHRWYGRYVRDLKVSWSTKNFTCRKKKAKRVDDGLVALALYDLETARFRGRPAAPVSSAVNFYELVKKSVSKLEYDSGCEEGVLASALGTVVTLCDEYFADSREDRAATLVHEARHTQADDADHVSCVGGKYKDDDQGCDQTFYSGLWKGSGYNADIVFYHWNMHKSLRRNELSKSVMQSMINSMIPDRFNQISAKSIKDWRKFNPQLPDGGILVL